MFPNLTQLRFGADSDSHTHDIGLTLASLVGSKLREQQSTFRNIIHRYRKYSVLVRSLSLPVRVRSKEGDYSRMRLYEGTIRDFSACRY